MPKKQKLSFKKLLGYSRLYALASVVILIITTIFWSLLSAKVQMSNADQLVNPYLFQHISTLQNAQFPAQHSFLFKWPLFYLVKLFGFSVNSYLYAWL